MGIEDMYASALKTEKQRLSKSTSFSKKLQKIDELRASGLLQKKSYRFPMRDTLGRNTNSSPKPAVAKQQFPTMSNHTEDSLKYSVSSPGFPQVILN